MAPHIRLPSEEASAPLILRQSNSVTEKSSAPTAPAAFRGVRKSSLENDVWKYTLQEQGAPALPKTIALQIRTPLLVQKIKPALNVEVINAHEFQDDRITIKKAHLYYRPVLQVLKIRFSDAGKCACHPGSRTASERANGAGPW